MSKQAPKAETPLCQLDKVSFVASGRTILDSISFSISPGEKISIVGPNGGGKTLLLRLIVGAGAPTEGSITIAKGTVIGYQPQQNTLDRSIPLSARALLNMTHDSSADSQLDEVVALLQLSKGMLDSQLTLLSGGERQMVMIARAMLRNPQLLILDEPGTYCDSNRLSLLYAAIERFSDASGCATLCVSHDISRVLAHSDHILCINHKLECEGGPEDIIQDSQIESLLDAENIGLYRHDHDH